MLHHHRVPRREDAAVTGEGTEDWTVQSDDNCLESAMAIREVLVFLVNQVAASNTASKTFTAGMRKLLDKKSK